MKMNVHADVHASFRTPRVCGAAMRRRFKHNSNMPLGLRQNHRRHVALRAYYYGQQHLGEGRRVGGCTQADRPANRAGAHDG